MLIHNSYEINPKAKNMAELLVNQTNKVEKLIGKNPNMYVKTYNKDNYVYQKRIEYRYTVNEILAYREEYTKSLENDYCPFVKLIIDK